MHQLFNRILSITLFKLVFRIQSRFEFFRSGSNQITAFQLVGLFESGFKLCGITVGQLFVKLVKFRRKDRSFPSFFTGFGFQLFNQFNNRLKVFKTEHNGTEHRLFGKFLRLGLNHQHAFLGTGHNQFQIRLFNLGNRRVQNIISVFVTDFGRSNRPQKRNAGNAQSGRSGNHRRNV